MPPGRRGLAPEANAAPPPHHQANLVGAVARPVGVWKLALASAICASLSTGCGARSALPGPSGPCLDGPAPPSGMVLGPGNVTALAADRCGYPILAGTTTDTLSFDGVTIAPLGQNTGPNDTSLPGTLFLARLGPSPFGLAFAPAWPSAHPLVRHMGLAVDDAGSVIVTAHVESPVDLGGGPLGATEGPSGIFARFDPAGRHVFSRALVATGGASVGPPVCDGKGNVFVAGHFIGALTLDGAPLGTADGYGGSYLAKLAPTGTLLWSTILQETGGDVQGQGNDSIPLAAWADGSLAAGIGESVTAFDPSGHPRWTQALAGALHVDASGTLMVIGGQPPLTRYLGPDGSLLGESSFPTPADQGYGLGVDSQGDVLAITAAGTGLVAVEQARSGQVLLSRPISITGGSYVYPALGGTRTPVLAGAFQGSVDLGTGLLTARPAADGSAVDNVFVAVLAL